jgi:hypothetical protein
MSAELLDQQYPFIVQNVMKHIEQIKKTDAGKSMALVDIIYDYCFRSGLDVELVGDAIASDVYFKSFIKKDCEVHRIFKSDIQKELEEW